MSALAWARARYPLGKATLFCALRHSSSQAYVNHRTSSLVKSLLVFRLCSVPNAAKALALALNASRLLHIRRPLMYLLRKTVFSQFCGGETVDEVKLTAADLAAKNVGVILDYAAEPALDVQYDAKTLPESYYDAVLKNVCRSIKLAQTIPQSFVAVKCSGLIPASDLRSLKCNSTEMTSSQPLFPDVELCNGIGRVYEVCQQAHARGVNIAFDAEQSDIQDAIDAIAIHCMAKFSNVRSKSNLVIYNTYQLYRIDGMDRLKQHLLLSQSHNFNFGCKLVRGAYLSFERELAQSMIQKPVVFDEIDKTHIQYDECVRFMLDYAIQAGETKDTRKFYVLLATHNLQSIRHAWKLTKELTQITPQPVNVSVSFAQLLGMSDSITLDLANSGAQCYKYVPYGPVNDVIPYLIRRVEENQNVFQHAEADARSIQKELIKRLNPFRKK